MYINSKIILKELPAKVQACRDSYNFSKYAAPLREMMSRKKASSTLAAFCISSIKLMQHK
jgi:hypothetical protein